MTPAETSFLQSVMSSGSSYLEYGSGRSTLMAVRTPSLSAIHSVESDAAFVRDHLLGDPEIGRAQREQRLNFHLVDIGPTKLWGHPRDRSKAHLWPEYTLAAYQARRDWDVILVDGRFRVACCLLAALESKRDCTVLIHDFSWRPQYHPILRFMRCVRLVDSLAQLKRREDFNARRASEMLVRGLFLPSDMSLSDRVRVEARLLLGKLRGRPYTQPAGVAAPQTSPGVG